MPKIFFTPVWEIRVDTSTAPAYLKLEREEVLGYFPGADQHRAIAAAIDLWEGYHTEKLAAVEASLGGPTDAMFEAQHRFNQHDYLLGLLYAERDRLSKFL